MCIFAGLSADGRYTYCAFQDNDYLQQQSKHQKVHSVDDEDLKPSPQDDKLDNEPGGFGEILPDNKTIKCPENKDFCYSLWLADPTDRTKVHTILKQGMYITYCT